MPGEPQNQFFLTREARSAGGAQKQIPVSVFRMAALDSEPLVRQWLLEFARVVRNRDYEAGRRLFAEDAVGFGTVAGRCDGLAELEARQWRSVWGVTSDFEFEMGQGLFYTCGELASVACFWRSYGCREDGSKLLRRGRCTFAFRIQSGQCLAVHSHFSLVPSS